MNPNKKETKTRASTHHKRVLLVDDSLLFLVALEGILVAGGNGWHTVKAADGREALAELENRSFDLIVTDYQMPNMNGLEFVAAVRQKLPGIPVIMLTGSDSRDVQEEAERLDIRCVLEKPIPGYLFLKAVREASVHSRKN